jgi:hypothetical protein
MMMNCIMHQFHHKVADCFQMALFNSTICHAAVENGEYIVLESPPTTTIIDGSTP